jgi:hypothetical protein
MAAAAQQRTLRDVVEFAPNVPVTLALKYNQGKHIVNDFGDRVMYSTVDNRVLFLDPEVAGQIEAAGVNVRESFTLCMRQDGKGTRTWEVARIAPAVGEQPDGTFAVAKLPEPKPPVSATAPERIVTAADRLVIEASALVDAYAMVLAHSLTKHDGRVKPDEIRALFITSYIQSGKRAAA